MTALLAIAYLVATAASSAHAPPATPAGATRSGKVTTPPPTHVEAENMEYRYKERQTVMIGKPFVTLTRADATLICRRLVADNDAAGDIRVAVCEGDVKLTRGERSVTCARATYYADAGRVVCRGDRALPGGDPVLRDGASVIDCEELTYDLDQDKVFLKKPRGTLVQRPGQALPLAKKRAP